MTKRAFAQATALAYLPSFRLEFASYSRTLLFDGSEGGLRLGNGSGPESIDVQHFVVECIKAIAHRGDEAVRSCGLAAALCAEFIPSLFRSVDRYRNAFGIRRICTLPRQVRQSAIKGVGASRSSRGHCSPRPLRQWHQGARLPGAGCCACCWHESLGGDNRFYMGARCGVPTYQA